MPSFDIVSELELFEVNHAVQNTQKRLQHVLTSVVMMFLSN